MTFRNLGEKCIVGSCCLLTLSFQQPINSRREKGERKKERRKRKRRGRQSSVENFQLIISRKLLKKKQKKKRWPTHRSRESNFSPNIENSGTIGGTGAEGPQKVTKPKSWVAAECQIRQRDTLHRGTKQPSVIWFSAPDDCHPFPLQKTAPRYRTSDIIHERLVFTLIKAQQEKTSNKFDALLISPLLSKLFLIDSRALALLKYAQTFST